MCLPAILGPRRDVIGSLPAEPLVKMSDFPFIGSPLCRLEFGECLFVVSATLALIPTE